MSLAVTVEPGGEQTVRTAPATRAAAVVERVQGVRQADTPEAWRMLFCNTVWQDDPVLHAQTVWPLSAELRALADRALQSGAVERDMVGRREFVACTIPGSDGGLIALWRADQKSDDGDEAFADFPHGIGLYDADHRLVWVNKRYRDLLGDKVGLLVPGASFKEIMTAAYRLGHADLPADQIETAIARRWQQFLDHETIEEPLQDGSVLLTQDIGLSDGRSLAMRTPVRGRGSAPPGWAAPVSAPSMTEVVNSLTDGFALYGPDRRLIYCNRQYRGSNPKISHLLEPGVPLETVVRAGVALGDLEHDFPTDEAYVQARLRAEGPPVEVRTASGWIQFRSRLLSDGSMAILESDINELKRREEELLASEALFRDFAETSSDWFWEIDERFDFTSFIGALSGNEGLPGGESLIGRSFFRLVGGEHGADDARQRDLMRARQPFRDYLVELTNRQGQQQWLRFSGRPFYDNADRFSGYRGVATDVTQVREAEQRAAQSQARMLAAINNSADGIALFDAEDRLVACNKRFQLDPGDADLLVPGTTWERILRDRVVRGLILHDHPSDEAYIQARFDRHRKFDETNEYQLSTGQWILAREHPSADGGYILILTDISTLKKREHQLSDARDEARKLVNAKSAFLANMSHELRTPLNAIIGFSDVMRQQVFGPLGSERYVEYVDGIRTSGEHLLALINDILELSKAEAGKLTLREAVVDLAATCREAVQVMQERAEAGQISMTATVPPEIDEIRIKGDGRKLMQIVLNLLSNAVKFTPEGGHVALRVHGNREDGVCVTVEDDGIGMSEADIETAFTAFGQVDHRRNRQHQGTGLGLPLCRQLVELHDGTLELISREGEGTRVTVCLPASRVLNSD